MNLLPHLGVLAFRKKLRFALMGFLFAVVLGCQPAPAQKAAPSRVPVSPGKATERGKISPTATTAKPASTPDDIYGGPQLQTPKVMQQPSPDVLAHMDWGQGGCSRCGEISCAKDQDVPITGSAGGQELADGQTVQIRSLYDLYASSSQIIETFPGLCVTDRSLANAARAVSPSGVAIRPYTSEFGSQANVRTGVWLPLEAFSQPGLWHLVIDAPDQHFDLGILIPRTEAPTYLLADDDSRLWLGGFDPNERIVGVALDPDGGAFEIQADSRGYALATNPLPENYEFVFTGENDHVGCYSCEPEISTALHKYYWHGGSEETNQAAIRACPGALSPRLSIGGQARVTFTDGSPLRVRSQAGKSAETIYRIPEGETVSVDWGPVCADGWMWWKVHTGGKNQIAGWAAEGDSQAGYWLEPLP